MVEQWESGCFSLRNGREPIIGSEKLVSIFFIFVISTLTVLLISWEA